MSLELYSFLVIVHIDGNAKDKNFKIRNSTGLLQYKTGLKGRGNSFF